MTTRFKYYFILLLMVAAGCGPGKQAPKSERSSDDEKKELGTGVEGDEARGTTTTEVPNVPFTMFGGGVTHHHRATVPGPETMPRIAATFVTGDRVFASPVIGPDGTCYIGSVDGSFNALKSDGSLRWSYVCSDAIFSTAAVSQSGVVYVGCDDDSLLAFTTDGMLRFTYRITHDLDSSPVIAEDGTIYVGGDGLHAVTSGGVRKWKALLNAHASSSPAIRSDGSIVITSHDYRVYAFDAEGIGLWAYGATAPVLSTPAILKNDGVVFGVDDGNVIRLTPAGGIKWKTQTGGAVKGGVAVSAAQTTLYVGSEKGTVVALDAKTGKILWEVQTGGPVRATPMLDSAGRLYVGSQDHYLYAVDSEVGNVLWRMDLGAQIDSTVAVAYGEKLIVGADNGNVVFLEAQ
ncbi:MAG: PQQ-like beta-propeller repeat protein [Deltaproteobacteria bacterium]|nr:PQQ-like beta-propeller repeat protein [Deltaproteobacteria bacterium]MBN2674057.1 PQQ-like beta-propeller repeat protein [Deltaproteobacteria bacterium]